MWILPKMLSFICVSKKLSFECFELSRPVCRTSFGVCVCLCVFTKQRGERIYQIYISVRLVEFNWIVIWAVYGNRFQIYLYLYISLKWSVFPLKTYEFLNNWLSMKKIPLCRWHKTLYRHINGWVASMTDVYCYRYFK